MRLSPWAHTYAGMDALTALILTLAASPWIYGAVLLLVLADSLFPLIPSEAAIVGLAALSAATGAPDLLVLAVTAAGSAVLGDAAAFGLGRWSRRAGWTLPHPGPLARLMDWGRAGLEHRTGLLLLTARFIPWARLAVNLVAGLEGHRALRLLPFWAIASLAWAGWNTAIGYLAGQWFGQSPLLAMALAIVAAILCGALVDLAASWLRRRAGRDPAAE